MNASTVGRDKLRSCGSIGENEEDPDDNGFPLRIESEISAVETEFSPLDGKTYAEFVDLSGRLVLCPGAIESIQV